jgi:hypothetical protein
LAAFLAGQGELSLVAVLVAAKERSVAAPHQATPSRAVAGSS